MARNLIGLLEYLERLPCRPLLAELVEVLCQSAITAEEVIPFARFDPKGYRRNLIRAGQHYHLWTLCWLPGQFSPVHDHNASACGVRVVQGTATVTSYNRLGLADVEPVRTESFPAGSVLASQDGDIHRVGNESADVPLITLHVYTPPLLHMATFLPDGLSAEDWYLPLYDMCEPMTPRGFELESLAPLPDCTLGTGI